MEVLHLHTGDFKLSVETTRLAETYLKAKGRYTSIDDCATYVFGTEVVEFKIADLPDSALFIPPDKNFTKPIFFENKPFTFYIEFTGEVQEARIYSQRKDVAEIFAKRKIGNVDTLIGTINFGNDIGLFDLNIRYLIDGKQKNHTFTFEVFPVKLDYKNDYRSLVHDIEEKYPQLVLDFLTKTYSNFSKGNGVGSEMVWWNVFGGLYERMLKNFAFILEYPNKRLLDEAQWVKQEKIRKTTPALEEEYHRFQLEADHYYQVTEKVLSSNTYENRFIKFALNQTKRRFKAIYTAIQNRVGDKLSAEYKTELDAAAAKMRFMANNPFFRTIGEFEGMKQESLVLQRKQGYSQILRDWLLLRKAYKLFEGAQKISLRDIAHLYQVWTYLKTADLIKDIKGIDPQIIEIADFEDYSFRDKRPPQEMRIEFDLPNGITAELLHEFEYRDKIDKLYNRIYTTVQRPDIVLRITRNDLINNHVFTYLFDAKYRVQSDDDDKKPDEPTEDSINQMHRYRDAIYYAGNQDRNKEVIGGYILFPGQSDETQSKLSKYFKSIDKVNIGAFPLLPGHLERNSDLLKEFLANILAKPTPQILKEVPPQKGKIYEPEDPRVTLMLVKDPQHIKYIRSGKANRTHFYRMPKEIAKGGCRFIAPVIKENGQFKIYSYFESSGNEYVKRSEAYPDATEMFKQKSDMVNVFDLKNEIILKVPLQLKEFKNFAYSTLYALLNAKDTLEVNNKDE